VRHNPLIDLRELEQLHDQCYSWALTCTGRRAEAEDVLQMTYLAIVEGRARFQGGSSLRTWLFAVIRNHARSRWRRARASLAALARLAAFAPALESAADADSSHDLERAQQQERLMSAWRSLPERQRAVLDLVFYRDLAIAEAAQVLGIAVGTARVHYERGKTALRRHLGVEQPRTPDDSASPTSAHGPAARDRSTP
jgi:RNA polymerase sigma-70 factor, ECF subfamily